LAVTFSVLSGPATVSGNILTITGAGTVVVAANQVGNANYSAAPQVTQTIVATQSSVTLTWTSSLNPSIYGNSVTFTVTVTGVFGGVTPTGTVAISDGATPITTLTLNASGTATDTIQTLTVGSHSLTAAYSGDANYQSVAKDLLRGVLQVRS
jgi:hypothetical protein